MLQKSIHEMKNFDHKHGLISLKKCNLEPKENLYFMVQQSFFFHLERPQTAKIYSSRK